MNSQPSRRSARQAGKSAPKPAQDVPPSPSPPQTAAAAPTATTDATGDTSRPKKTKVVRISVAVAQLLQDHFERNSYGMNQKLPQHGGDAILDRIIADNNLKRTQASNQLRKYRVRKFKHGDVWLQYDECDMYVIFHVYDEEEDIRTFLEMIIDPDKMEKVDEYSDYASKGELKYMDSFRKVVTSDLLDSLNGLVYTDEFLEIWVDMATFYASEAAEVFPKTLKNIRPKDLSLISRRQEEMKRICRSNKWVDMKPSGVSDKSWAAAFAFIEESFFMSWARRLSLQDEENNADSLTLPQTDLVSKYADAVVYYVASWLVAQLMVANRAGGVENKRAFMNLAEHNNLSSADATRMSLPTAVVDRRERKSLRRASKSLYALVRKIESWHVANLTLRMMVKYSDGELLNAIQQAILSDEGILADFELLCKNSDGTHVSGLRDAKQRKAALEFLLLKFQRMRGREFERTIRGQSGKSRRAADISATTRINVAMQTGASKEGISREKDAESRLKAQYKKMEEHLVELPNDGIEDTDGEETAEESEVDSDYDE